MSAKIIFRIAVCVVGLVLFATHSVAATSHVVSNNPHDLSGVWWIENYQPKLTPQNGSAIPFTPAGQALYQKNMDALAKGTLLDETLTKCLPEGLPRSMNSAYPLQIVHSKNFITVINEANHMFWFIDLKGKHPSADEIDPAFMGQNIGHWQGDTLVVDGLGFKARNFIDGTGTPVSERLHLTQRLKKLGNKQLEDLITIEDPLYFTAPWTARLTYELRPDVQIMEYPCGESHRILTGSRAQAVQLDRKIK